MSSLLEELREALREHYAVESEVGRGGMATVFLAEDLKHGRRVAVKVLSPELSSSLDSDRFKREIQIAARLSHPHILPVFDSGDANGLLYYVMPFVEGESLRGRIKRESQLPIDDAIAIACEVADALSYAHSFGVIHRDIKPENILLHGGHAVVADFGIARVIQDAGGEKLTQTGISVGTASYMSPEQFGGEKIDGRSDLYSLACVVYEMLVGEVPFTGPNAIAIMARHTMELPPSIQIVRGTVPDELEGAIMHALEKVPADRFATVAQFKDALLGQGATSTYARRTRANTRAYTAQHPRISSPVRRRRMTLAFGGLAIVLLAAGSLAARYYWVKSHAPLVQQAGDTSDGLSTRRIAVLYFADESKGDTLAHVASGLTESLISRLSEVEGLDVVPAEGVAPYKNGVLGTDTVARTLKAGTLIRGAIEDDGNQLRITTQLIDGSSGTTFRRESFEFPRAAILTARDSLSEVVADLLRQWIGAEVRLRGQRNATTSAEAWSVVQRVQNLRKTAEQLLATSNQKEAEQRLASADSLAARAELLDPKWAEPLVQRGWIAYALAQQSTEPTQTLSLLDSAMARGSAAIAIDPRSADAFELRGTARYQSVRKELLVDQRAITSAVDAAESDLRQATKLNPRQAGAWNELSMVAYGKFNVVQANAAARKAYESDAYLSAAPAILNRLWVTSYDLGSFADAIHWCNEGQQRFPNDPRFPRCQLYLMISPAVKLDVKEAWRMVSEVARLSPKQSVEFNRREAEMFAAVVIGRSGLRDSANRVLERARAGADIDPQGELVGIEVVARTQLGELDKAFPLLERYLTNHPDHRDFTKANPWWWQDLRKDPRFSKLVGAGS